MSTMRALVTGGAGFIGSQIALRLAHDGHHVVAADTFAEGRWENLIEFTRLGGDVLTLDGPLELEPLRRAGPFDAVFHQAAVTGVIKADGSADTGPSADKAILRNNVEGFRGILDLAADWGARLVWASSCSVYGRGPVPMRESAEPDPLNAYAFSKLAKERLADRRADELPAAPVGLRYSNVYGPHEWHKGPLASMIYKLAAQMRDGGRPRIFEHGEQRRDFVHVDDVVEANLLAERASREGRLDKGRAHVFNVGAGRSWSFNELVAELNGALSTSLEPDYFKNPFAFTQDHTETDVSLAGEHLGWRPALDLKAGLARYAQSGELGVPRA